jgi:hypothetical protein
MKTGKEVKSAYFNEYNVVFGSVNNKNPKAIYINISAWAQPNSDEELSYSRVIRNINKNIKQTIYDLIDLDSNSVFQKERTIVDLDIRESGIRYGKRSFMNCEITLFTNVEIPVNTEMMKEMLTNVSKEVIEDIFENSKIFKFYKRKK